MQFIITAHDGVDALDKRMEVRPRHLEGVAKLGKHVLCAGGIMSDEGTLKGSVLIMDMPNREALDEYLASEPYVTEHVWEKIEVEPMNVVVVSGEKIGK